MRRRAIVRTTHADAALVAAAIAPDNTDEMETVVSVTTGDGSEPERDDGDPENGDRDPERGEDESSSDDPSGEDGERTAVLTRIERETTGGLHSTVDDYLVNLDVADGVAARATGREVPDANDANHADTTTTTDTHE
ncbi:KEOPS complex subunit Pcc1 [Halovivax sp.]|uniref:KEOPS complex subunit Pcc1 n=1 Tax=Halovivax sp. TaxID=1935978 RepID=UPI0025C42D2B|nr:KEOPS complex subunit Pcc1 [Halovivax sp.]